MLITSLNVLASLVPVFALIVFEVAPSNQSMPLIFMGIVCLEAAAISYFYSYEFEYDHRLYRKFRNSLWGWLAVFVFNFIPVTAIYILLQGLGTKMIVDVQVSHVFVIALVGAFGVPVTHFMLHSICDKVYTIWWRRHRMTIY